MNQQERIGAFEGRVSLDDTPAAPALALLTEFAHSQAGEQTALGSTDQRMYSVSYVQGRVLG